MVALVSLRSGDWEVTASPVQEVGASEPDHTNVIFRRPEAPESRMMVRYPGGLEIGEATDDELRSFARRVRERTEELDGAVWTFRLQQSDLNPLAGVPGGGEPSRRVTLHRAGRAFGAGELPPRIFLCDATLEELRTVVELATRVG